MDANTPRLVDLVRIGADTPEEVKEDAFRIWIELGRSWKRTSERTGIAVSTLHHWANVGDWQERRQREASAFLPGMMVETVLALRMAAHRAALRLQQLAYQAEEEGTPLNVKEVQALSLIIDRGGLSPVGNKTLPDVNLKGNETNTLADLAGKSPDELSRREQSFRQSR